MFDFDLSANAVNLIALQLDGRAAGAAVRAILYPERQDAAVARYCRDGERRALEQLGRLLAQAGHTLQSCGLFVSTEKCFLAATPDGTVDDDGLVEVKCPLGGRDRSLASLASQDKDFCLALSSVTGALSLKRSHNYFYQLQGQLQIANR